MIDLRGLQRTLFRMQADPSFAEAVLRRDGKAVESTGLGLHELELLPTELSGVTADPGGRRRMQIAGNAASEFVLSLAGWGRRSEELLDEFLVSDEFHVAIHRDERLPLAFGAFLARRADAARDATLGAIVALERELAELRRQASRLSTIPSPHPPYGDAPGKGPEPGGAVAEIPRKGAVVLAPGVRLIRLPAGTFAASSTLRVALDTGDGVPAPPAVHASELETVLAMALPPFSPHRLPELSTELLQPPTDALLERARNPVSRIERDDIAREHGAEPADLEAFLVSFIEDGAVLRID